VTGVVLRCPNCGTVQGASGECDACHEGEVRYFCTNHAPGLWIEAPVCGACGARFGEVHAEAPASAVESRPRGADTREADILGPTEPDLNVARSPWGSADDLDERSIAAEHERALRSLHEALEGSSGDRGWPPDAAYGSERARREMGGCGKTMIVTMLLFLMLFVLGPLLLGGAVLRLFF
jgi:hypothetical protein